MLKGQLPDEGPARLGPVILPTGKLVDGYTGTGHVAWVTADPVPDSGRVWAALSELHSHTGLIPILLGRHYNTAGLPLDLFKPEHPREADRVDVGALLENLWRGSVWADVDDPEAMERWSPFTLEWPGLAPPERALLTPGEQQQALGVMLPQIRQEHAETPEARIGLVAAGRPADVLAVIGWAGLVNRGESLLPLTAVLRSWGPVRRAVGRCGLRRPAAVRGTPAANPGGGPAPRRRAGCPRRRLHPRGQGHPRHSGPPCQRAYLDLLVGLNRQYGNTLVRSKRLP